MCYRPIVLMHVIIALAYSAKEKQSIYVILISAQPRYTSALVVINRTHRPV